MNLSNSSALIQSSDDMKFRITALNGVSASNQQSNYTPTINLSGISNVKQDTRISTNVIITGQKNIPILKFSLQLKGDTVEKNDLSETKRVQFSFTNDASNFVTNNASNGIVKASLYYVPRNKHTNIDTIRSIIGDPDFRVMEVCNTCPNTFTSTNTLDFKFTPRETPIGQLEGKMYDAFGSLSPSENFIVTYDLGEDTVITSNTSISIKPTQFNILGDDSDIINNMTASTIRYPVQPYELNTYIPERFINVGGLSLTSIENAVPLNSVFGPNTRTPILKFKLRAIHTSLTLNRVTILNAYSTTGPGTIPFRLSEESNEGIKQIDLYYDEDRNDSFSYSDTLVGNILKGDQRSIARLPITGNGLLISEYDEDASSGYTNDNSAVFFTVYHFGVLDFSGTTTKTAIAHLGNVITSVNINGQNHSITLPGISETSPAVASPEATLTLGETNVNIEKITDISLDTIVQGHIKAPMLKIKLVVNNGPFVNTTFQIQNEGQPFLDNSTGVDKVWIYRDNNTDGTQGAFDSTDTFLSASQGNSDGTTVLSIPGVKLDNGTYSLLLLYDIGQVATLGNNLIKAQLNTITASDENLILGGELFMPDPPATANVTKGYLTDLSLDPVLPENWGDVGEPPPNATPSVKVKLSLRNNHSSAVPITALFPKIYHNSIGGTEISSEFTTSPPTPTFTLPPNQAGVSENKFNIVHSNELSDGFAILDMYIEYQVTSNQFARIQRYQNETGWHGTVTNNLFLRIFQTIDPNNPWTNPSYIQAMHYKRGGIESPFYDQMALKNADQLIFTFDNNGNSIDESSLNLTLNGEPLTRMPIDCDNSISNTYCYDTNNGRLTIPNLGSADGTITLSLNDTQGNSLDSTTVRFVLSSILQLNQPLFYPNPYILRSKNLKLGFNLNVTEASQSTTIKVYFFNALGQLIHTQETVKDGTGYKTITFEKNSSFLTPGVYLIKIVATDNNGNQSIGTTKLGVH